MPGLKRLSRLKPLPLRFVLLRAVPLRAVPLRGALLRTSLPCGALRLLLLAAMLLPLPAAGLRAQALRSLQERLGDTLDSYERSYFGLFPGLEGFTSATLLLEGDSLRFIVHRSAGAADTGNMAVDSSIAMRPREAVPAPDSSIALSPAEALMLERLVDGYEQIMDRYPPAMCDTQDDPDRQELERRFDILLQRGILRLHSAELNKVPPVELSLRNGETSTGTMLFFTDSLLALRTVDIPFHWRSADSGVEFHPYRDVESIARRSAGSFGRGAGPGLLVGTCVMTLLVISAVNEKSQWSDSQYSITIGCLMGGLPGFFIGGSIGMLPAWRDAWKGSELPAAWLRNAALADAVFVFTRRLPPEWRSRFDLGARTMKPPTTVAENAAPPPTGFTSFQFSWGWIW